MAAARGQPGTRLIDRLVSDPEAFEVFEAARLVEDAAVRAARRASAEVPPEVGGQDAGAGTRDPVRFSATVMLGFPGASIVSAKPVKPAGHKTADIAVAAAMQLEIASFGLVGPSGALPRHYTTLTLQRLRRFRDRTLRDFLDIFTHRAMTLLARAWGKYRPAVQRGRLASRGTGAPWDDAPQPRDPITAVLASLIGIGTRTLAERMRVDDSLLLHYAGHLARWPAAALPLEQLIADAWHVEASIEQFVGRWLDLEPGDQTRLGSGRLATNAMLGVNAMAGRRVWSVESAYCVRLGPMPLAEFLNWLPGNGRLGALSDLLTLHVGPTLEATVRPVLRAAEVPESQLGGAGGSRLGWTTWLISAPPAHDAADAAFPVRFGAKTNTPTKGTYPTLL
jgi:type VI secretion system protein ImpH